MKKIFLLILTTIALSYSCAGETKTCEETGCDAGKHCIIEKDLCVQDCTPEYCAPIGEVCNPNTKECELSCEETGCDTGFVCNTSNNKCEASCLEVQCSDGLHCNTKTKLCEANCVESDCNSAFNEVCDPESNVCVVKADVACDENSCVEGSHCNTYTGNCVGGCADIKCNEGDVCNPSLLRCVHECTPGICKGESFCNIESKLCEAFVSYPPEPYGKLVGTTIKDLEWLDTDKKIASLRKYHSMAVKTGYPRVIILVESAGWCSPCRQEAPALKSLYEDKRLPNGQERVAVIQTIVDDNINDGIMSNPDEFAKSWKDQYGMEFPVAGDNGSTSEDGLPLLEAYNASGSIPFNIIINAQTMKIVGLENGTDEVLSGLISKIRDIEQEMLCEPLDCAAKDSYCIYRNDNGTAKCN
jgi:thiol-disulfide isomerase/thioredoxin